MIERQRQSDITNSLILSGADVCNLPATLLWSYSEKISTKLGGPNTVSCEAKDLYQAMLNKKAVVAIDIFTNKLLGFAQVKQIAEKKWEFRSWVAFEPGLGKPILSSGSELIHGFDPEAQAVAKVREGNISALKVIEEMGGKLVGHETSETHSNSNTLQPIHKSVFDISLSTLTALT